MDIFERLRLIAEGTLLTEADDDKYSLSNTDAGEGGDNNQDTDPEPATSDDLGDDNADADPTTDEGGDNQDGADGSDGDTNADGDPATSDTMDDGSDGAPEETDNSKVLSLDASSRAILAYNNFYKYRELRDSATLLVNELSEFIPVKDYIRDGLNVAIQKATELQTKLNDYIIYKYESNSYETNYKNYTQFMVEFRLVQQMKNEIIKISDQEKA